MKTETAKQAQELMDMLKDVHGIQDKFKKTKKYSTILFQGGYGNGYKYNFSLSYKKHQRLISMIHLLVELELKNKELQIQKDIDKL